MEHWPFEKKWNPLEIILNQDIIDEQLTVGHMAPCKNVFQKRRYELFEKAS